MCVSSVIVLLMTRKLVFVVSEEDICSLTQPDIKTSLYKLFLRQVFTYRALTYYNKRVHKDFIIKLIYKTAKNLLNISCNRMFIISTHFDFCVFFGTMLEIIKILDKLRAENIEPSYNWPTMQDSFN